MVPESEWYLQSIGKPVSSLSIGNRWEGKKKRREGRRKGRREKEGKR